MQTIELDLEEPDFFCPATGQRILGEEACTPSPATVYVYIQEENVFDFVRPDLRRVAEGIETSSVLDDDDDDEDEAEHAEGERGAGAPAGTALAEECGEPCLRWPFDAMKEALPGPSVLDFVLRTTEMACGPVHTTIHIGIDMSWNGKG